MSKIALLSQETIDKIAAADMILFTTPWNARVLW